ncbi:5957_t:CDS:2 [Ambispora leptoticha]|uniref:5957_t:CDS:1 n=1 Tax=Ambispora leptoticha TaxID=144679 RepID=A0A9N9F3C4_9GLOM|nr:5957_t:CDS:2 [Ambispora leptoticha]
MVSSTNTQPKVKTVEIDRVELSNAITKLSLSDQLALESGDASPTKNVLVVEKFKDTNMKGKDRNSSNDSSNGVNGTATELSSQNSHSNNNTGSNVIANGKNSEVVKQPTVAAAVAVTENSADSLKNEDVVSHSPHNNEKNKNNSEQQVSSTSSSAETKESQPPKKIPIPAPIPPVNFWDVRKEAMQSARKAPANTNSNMTSGLHSSNVTVSNNNRVEKQCKGSFIDNNINKPIITKATSLANTTTKSSTMDNSNIIKGQASLDDQSSWPAPGEVLIKDKEKEANENTERKQSPDISKKEEISSKRGKGKWIPYTPIKITHSTPLPNHGQKHRRRSEASVPHTEPKEHQTSIEEQTNNNPGSETLTTTTSALSVSSSQQNGNSNPRRRYSLPQNGREQYSRRYSQSSIDNGQYVRHTNNLSFRGGRRGLGSRSRPFNGTRALPRSATFSYSTGWQHQFGNVYTAKMPSYVYDLELLKFHILQQVEYYFSVENLCKDIYLRSNMDTYGFVDISLLANFNRVKLLTLDEKLVREALLNSYVIEVSNDKARKRDGWEMWLLPNQNQQNINDPTLAESTYDNTKSLVSEGEYANRNNDSETMNHANKENQEPKQEQVVIENTAATIPSMSTINELDEPPSNTTTTTFTHNNTSENFEPLIATASR